MLVSFAFSGLGDALEANQIQVDPPGPGSPYEAFFFGDFYPNWEKNIEPAGVGYLVRLYNPPDDSLRMEITNLPEVAGLWDASDAALTPSYWEMTVSGLPRVCQFSITEVPAEDVDGNIIMPNPVGLE